MERFSTSGDMNSVILGQMKDIPSSGSSSSSGNTSGHLGSNVSGSSRNTMDELSIDSATNEKIKIDSNANRNKRANQHQVQQQHKPRTSSTSATTQQQRPHFKIEWRQLSYYQKERSYLSKLLFNENKKHNCNDNDSNNNSKTNGARQAEQPKRILNSLDGCFRSGQLSAILGPSGAGKSTFLSTLFGNKQDGAYGQTKVTWFGADQRPLVEERRSIKIASLPQNDHLLHHLTVYESLMFASKIKNATRPKAGKNFHRQNVRRVAKMLKLGECLDTRCGKLSGGQYKRVSIGQELLSEPDVIILDEPTSGLDAMTCLTTVQTLKSIAMKHPISIILTIHQPDIDVFSLFDHVYVIAQGGLAIYEGPPEGIVPTLAQVDLNIPSHNYNPARYIVENAFVFEPSSFGVHDTQTVADQMTRISTDATGTCSSFGDCQSNEGIHDNDSDETEDADDDDDDNEREKKAKNYLRQSVLSLTEVISGREMVSKKDKKPLLNIGIQTLDGKLITSDQLARDRDRQAQLERWNLLKRLNQIQKAQHRIRQDLMVGFDQQVVRDPDSDRGHDMMLSEPVSSGNPCEQSLDVLEQQQQHAKEFDQAGGGGEKASSAKSDYSSSGWSVHGRKHGCDDTLTNSIRGGACGSGGRGDGANNDYRQYSEPAEPMLAGATRISATTSLALIPGTLPGFLLANRKQTARSLQTINSRYAIGCSDGISSQHGSMELGSDGPEFVSVSFPPAGDDDQHEDDKSLDNQCTDQPESVTIKRQFDKRLSAKHNCSKQSGHPIWYHAFLLTHRTWLSIVRDPIFFGIQAIMHTTIPIILALIFGSGQEEGCPRVGNFDLVDFAYADSENMIQGTVSSIRKSIGNIGIAFFEMFVLSFSINCITALVFPLDMHVLLKEYRNGWYSLRSYLMGRTLADLPIPVVLHSIGMSILYFMTGQPHSSLRYAGIIIIVIISSLVAQSIGLTIGALLMKSSQSAVLAAAGVVAPLFALSGFIVRIHTLPAVAQLFATCSYLYHLLNGFIILRYGFGRCQCSMEDFEQNNAHQIPSNLHTLASMWIGTYSNEYSDSQVVASSAGHSNRTNVDPNIDVVDKMMTAFKMANSYGHQIHDCGDVLPYAMLDFNLRDSDIYGCFIVLIFMLVVSRFITFAAIYYKVRSYA